MRILIVDDSAFLRRMLQRIVETSGHQVIDSAGDGLQGLESYKKNQPDLVLLDITMPNMSGKECLTEILKINKEAKVIMVSALSTPELTEECIRIGAKAFFSKEMSASFEEFRSNLTKKIDEVMQAA